MYTPEEYELAELNRQRRKRTLAQDIVLAIHEDLALKKFLKFENYNQAEYSKLLDAQITLVAERIKF